MKRRISEHFRSNVIGYIALFFALSGGAAWATHPGGAGTISSADLIDGTVRSEDIRDSNLTTADIQTGAVVSGKILDNTITPNDIDGVGFLRSRTVTLRPQGGSISQTLFSVGRVDLVAQCTSTGDGNLRGVILPLGGLGGQRFAGDGPMLVIDGSDTAPERAFDLEPEDSQTMVFVQGTSVSGDERSFALMEDGGTSASGTAAVVVDPADGKCQITAQAVG